MGAPEGEKDGSGDADADACALADAAADAGALADAHSEPPALTEAAPEAELLAVVAALPDASFDLIYLDPPFNTGRSQRRTVTTTTRDEDGDRLGFHGVRYRTRHHGTKAFDDRFDDYLAFLRPRL